MKVVWGATAEPEVEMPDCNYGKSVSLITWWIQIQVHGGSRSIYVVRGLTAMHSVECPPPRYLRLGA